MYGKKDDFLFGDIKNLEDNQMDKLEDNQQEHVYGEDDIDLGMRSIFKYQRRHLIELFTKIKKSQKKDMYFVEMINIFTIHFSL